MKFSEKEKKIVGDATFIALADLIKKDKDQTGNLALLGLVLRNYIRTNRLPEGGVSETDLDRQIVNLLILFLENTHEKIREKMQIPEAFTPIKYVFRVDAQIDQEGTTIPAYSVKIDVTPEMIHEVNEIILKLGHQV
jgi:hypothetical protein